MDLELGLLIADSARLDAALAHVVQPEKTQIFLMDDGVCAQGAPRVRSLIDAGTDVTLCAMDAEARREVAYDGGPRFGSQYDHARLVRDAACVVAVTAAGISKSRPDGLRRRVGVTITGEPRDPATIQALRTAVGYLGCNLEVRVRLASLALGLLHDDHPREVLRHLSTLRGLGVKIERLPASPVDVEVIW
jgi:hypothetical protein